MNSLIFTLNQVILLVLHNKSILHLLGHSLRESSNFVGSGVSRDVYAAYLNKLEKAAEWFNKLGISISSSRIDKYLKTLKKLCYAWDNQEIETYSSSTSAEEFFTTIAEAIELIGIHEGLTKLHDPRLYSKLKMFKSGHFLPADDPLGGTGGKGRDIAFELNICSRLAASGCEIDISGDADVSFEDSGTVYFLECKRPYSASSLRGAFKKARRQLLKRFEAVPVGKQVYGMIAISLSRILGEKLLIAPDFATMNSLLSDLMSSAIDTYKKDFLYKPVKRIVGVLTHFVVPGLIRGEALPLSIQQTGYYSLSQKGSKSYENLIKLFMNLEREDWTGRVKF